MTMIRWPLAHIVLITAAQSAPSGEVQAQVPFPPKGELKAWRMPIMQRITSFCGTAVESAAAASAPNAAASPSATHAAATSDTTTGSRTCMERDIYTFGVYTGRALRAISRHINKTHTRCCHGFFGFDSFRGLPPDLPPLRANRTATGRRVREGTVYWADMIRAGGSFGPEAFSVSRLLETTDVAAMVARVEEYAALPGLQLIPGFFNESLTPSLPTERGMRPALYVDIDTDIYVSTYQALDWM